MGCFAHLNSLSEHKESPSRKDLLGCDTEQGLRARNLLFAHQKTET
jgi:hypothetical protein